MYPGQYQNFQPPQMPQHPQQMIGGVQHVLVPQGWAPPPHQQQPQQYYVAAPPPPHATVQMLPTGAFYTPNNPFAVPGMTYAQVL